MKPQAALRFVSFFAVSFPAPLHAASVNLPGKNLTMNPDEKQFSRNGAG